MKRFFVTAMVTAVAVTLLAVSQTQAAGHSSSGSNHSSMGNHRSHYKPSERFHYDRHGYKSLSWSRYYWNSHYRCYCYWAPSYGWCFYEPTYSCYVPVTYFRQVYPEAPATVAPTVTPPVVQQTTVVNVPSVAPALPTPPPAPTAVVPAGPIQQTKVGTVAP
jgi:hypothetical protein